MYTFFSCLYITLCASITNRLHVVTQPRTLPADKVLNFDCGQASRPDLCLHICIYPAPSYASLPPSSLSLSLSRSLARSLARARARSLSLSLTARTGRRREGKKSCCLGARQPQALPKTHQSAPNSSHFRAPPPRVSPPHGPRSQCDTRNVGDRKSTLPQHARSRKRSLTCTMPGVPVRTFLYTYACVYVSMNASICTLTCTSPGVLVLVACRDVLRNYVDTHTNTHTHTHMGGTPSCSRVSAALTASPRI